MQTTFLTAYWENLAMINYEIDPSLLNAYVPKGTELDFWSNKTYVSLVGFLFKETRLKGIAVPFHTHFEEINLRFYVRFHSQGTWKRGVVFIKEIVPKKAIAFIANAVYHENYVALPTSHVIEKGVVKYAWQFNGRENFIQVCPVGEKQAIASNTEAEFITEHYWGYTKQKDDSTVEYEVRHPKWNIQTVADIQADIDVEALYGKAFVETLAAPPTSAFLADGSIVEVLSANKI